MADYYLLLKLLHIFVAVVALGTSAGLAMVLEFYAGDAMHGSFVLRAIERVTALVVFPGYVLMLASGYWLARLAWPLDAAWIQCALGLWVVGMASLAWSFLALRKQHLLHRSAEYGSARYRRASRLSRVSGASFGLVVVALLYLMVFKPSN